MGCGFVFFPLLRLTKQGSPRQGLVELSYNSVLAYTDLPLWGQEADAICEGLKDVEEKFETDSNFKQLFQNSIKQICRGLTTIYCRECIQNFVDESLMILPNRAMYCDGNPVHRVTAQSSA